jgi:hypothetical protein
MRFRRIAAVTPPVVRPHLVRLNAVPVLVIAAPQRPGSSQPGLPPLVWHKLHLINGWVSSQGTYGTGDPSFAIRGGVVYLSGSLHGGTSPTFAYLPTAARPARWLYVTVYTFLGTSGTLRIMHDGALAAYSAPAANAVDYTSLAAVSYPVGQIARHKLALRNGWQSSQGVFDTGDPSYASSGGVVYLYGSLHGGTASLFAVLPRADRPARVIYRSIYTFADTSGYLAIYPNGDVFANGADAQTYTSLAAISFPSTALTRHKLTLRNGWVSAQHVFNTGDPGYAVVGGVVYLYGSVRQPSGSSELATVLPKTARPAHNLFVTTYTAGGATGSVEVSKSGQVYVFSSATPAAAQALALLGGISFPRGS